MLSLKTSHFLPLLLAAARLPRSTFFHRQAAFKAPDRHAELHAQIHGVFTEAKGRYGHRRIHAALARDGRQVTRKTVLNLMRAFDAGAANQKWVTDVQDRRAQGLSLHGHGPVRPLDYFLLGVGVAEHGLHQPVARRGSRNRGSGRGPDGALDQGIQYQHAIWQKLLGNAGLTQSMSRKGNSVMENFFADLGDYIRWYTTDRVSLTLGCLSPMEYRDQAPAA